jgi:hypothetical protein
MKAAWLRDDAVLDDTEKWLAHLRLKYGVSTSNGRTSKATRVSIWEMTKEEYTGRFVPRAGRGRTATLAFAKADIEHDQLPWT